MLWSGIKVNSGMGLPMLHTMSILKHKVSSNPFPSPSSYTPFSYWFFPFFPFSSIGSHTPGFSLNTASGLLWGPLRFRWLRYGLALIDFYGRHGSRTGSWIQRVNRMHKKLKRKKILSGYRPEQLRYPDHGNVAQQVIRAILIITISSTVFWESFFL